MLLVSALTGNSGAPKVRRLMTYRFYSCRDITSHTVLAPCVDCYTNWSHFGGMMLQATQCQRRRYAIIPQMQYLVSRAALSTPSKHSWLHEPGPSVCRCPVISTNLLSCPHHLQSPVSTRCSNQAARSA